MTRSLIYTLVISIIVFVGSACSTTTTPQPPLSETQVSKPQAPASTESSQSLSASDAPGIKLIWQVPGSEEVIKYHIYYGTISGQLTSHREVLVNELTKEDHPLHGEVYYYQLTEVPASEELFIAIQGENEMGLSPLSREIQLRRN